MDSVSSDGSPLADAIIPALHADAVLCYSNAGTATILLMPFYVTGLHPRNEVGTLIPVVLANEDCTRREGPGKAYNRRMVNWSPQFLRVATRGSSCRQRVAGSAAT